MYLVDREYVAFSDQIRVATGDLEVVVAAAKAFVDGAIAPCMVLVFDVETSEPVEIDLRGTAQDVIDRYRHAPQAPEPMARRSPGRPKLGVVSREVTLLPRHWEWLVSQPGSASVTLRRLVEQARLQGSTADAKRCARESAYRFMIAMAGDEPGFEEATRALYSGDAERFAEFTASWPKDVGDHARRIAAAAFSVGEA